MQGALKYDELGTLDDIIFILDLLRTGEKERLRDIIDYCANDIGFSRIPAQGTLALLKGLGYIWADVKEIVLTKSGFVFLSLDINEKRNKIINEIINWIKNDQQFKELFESIIISYDHTTDLYIIRNGSIPLNFSGLKKLLLNLGVFYFLPSSNNKILALSHEHLDLFEELLVKRRKQITLDQFKQNLVKMEVQGAAAEEFVLIFERQRIKNHPHINRVKIISKIDVGAGYDIISFESNDSVDFDRFIEVKSFSSQPSFHWSANEIDVARRKGDRYLIYLVEFNRLSDSGYSPLIIRNPYYNVLHSTDWRVVNDGLYIRKVDKF